ncbi:hypothetical protein [Thermasporomyces composti]|uniref:hypothetical protein n=1 Tax=Thermasporomyces composti TaxID=696763 RepID=UPI0014760BC5|nr:hypothetical protein [Thermasporomyces composti]
MGSATFELVDGDQLMELHQELADAASRLERVGTPPEGVPRHAHDWWFSQGQR